MKLLPLFVMGLLMMGVFNVATSHYSAVSSSLQTLVAEIDDSSKLVDSDELLEPELGFKTESAGCRSSNLLDEAMDQSSQLGTCGVYNRYLAQSFRPSLDSLSKVEIGLFKNVNASGYVSVSIRQRLYGEDLVTKTISVDRVPTSSSGDWVEFDFNDIEVTPHTSYYIVFTLNNGTVPAEKDATVHWIMSPINHFYFKGRAWVRGTIVPSVWHPLLLQPRPPDLSFQTYGYSQEIG